MASVGAKLDHRCVLGTLFSYHNARHHIFAPRAAFNLYLIVAISCAAEVIWPSIEI